MSNDISHLNNFANDLINVVKKFLKLDIEMRQGSTNYTDFIRMEEVSFSLQN